MQEARANRLREGTAIVSQQVDRFYEELRQARLEGRKAAWCDGYPLPFPLLVAMDIPYVFGDAYAATVAARHQEKELQEVAEAAGYILEICSYTRNAMGCARYPEAEFDKARPIWQMPKAEFVIVSDPGCSMLVNWGDDERRFFNVPIFSIQIPHVWSQAEEEEAVADCTHQLEELVTFLEDMTQRRFAWERLKEIMAGVREATMFRKQAMEMCRVKPSPATFFDLAACLGGVNYALGKPECVDIYRTLRDEIAGRVERGEGAVVDEEYRLYWDGIMCWPKLGHLATKFARLGACVVCGRYTHKGFYSSPESIDPEKPLESLAINAVANHTNHNLDWLIETISNLCLEYSIDGLVCHAHRTCRPLAAPQLEIMDGVSRRLGIPAIFFEADMADATFYSDGQVDTRLQALLETIASRRKKG